MTCWLTGFRSTPLAKSTKSHACNECRPTRYCKSYSKRCLCCSWSWFWYIQPLTDWNSISIGAWNNISSFRCIFRWAGHYGTNAVEVCLSNKLCPFHASWNFNQSYFWMDIITYWVSESVTCCCRFSSATSVGGVDGQARLPQDSSLLFQTYTNASTPPPESNVVEVTNSLKVESWIFQLRIFNQWSRLQES